MSKLGLIEDRTFAVAVFDETVTRGAVNTFLRGREKEETWPE